jgi:hypothetical protein
MKSLIIGLIIISQSFACFSQVKDFKYNRTCSDIMNEVSYYWKLDSIPNNGFRFYTYRMFLSSKLDNITRETLLEKLGKPNSLIETNIDIQYRYYYFDIIKMPKDFDAPYSTWFISFNFNPGSKYVTKIETGEVPR